ncbi:type I polyketide synthase [Nonomuraea ceibae]|uniref:type I polyketide synthase n=1 Tax=Nonomuraea ceibae TaxID=1935170 RepID=UPI001C5E3E1D|nr:type I polyketide synthase [Nonomuraea ceibae]
MSAGGNGQAWPRQAVAIVGVGCRLPGGIRDLDGLWQALLRGDDLVGTVPPDRFEADRYVDESIPRLDRSYTRAGGFLDDVTGFDAAYFGISPKEAASMDPQQRLLLEMAAEAFDDAGIDPARLAGGDTGVFVGVSDPSYGVLQALEPGGMGPYTMSGMALSIAANRLSHAFDLRGPSMSIDTACSSALQAVERACRALADGSASTALAGGVNVLLNPMGFIGFSQAAMLSPTGRCRAFSADADGFVRAEGGGVVVLKLLDDALADGDRVHGVIVGAAANNDGRTMGLALPSTEAQEALLRQVYWKAGVDPDEVAYVEAHGTGTQAGDPAECGALGRALGTARSSGPLPIGSVKTNLGHLEPASGMPGLFKALLVLRHRTIPASLHASVPNPAIDFDGLGLSIVTEPRPLPETGGRTVVGVNSFGFGGANVHVAVAAPPSVGSSSEGASGVPGRVEGAVPMPVVVSARSGGALTEAVARAAAHLETVGADGFYDVAYTAARRRGLHRHRAVVLAASPAEAAGGLSRLYATGDETRTGASAPKAVTGEAVEHGRVALVFCGNGSQWAGMGADLLGEPAFRQAVEAVDGELADRLGWSVLRELELPPDRWRLSATEVAQPLLFAVQAGVAAMLEAAGVRAGAVLGHSVGEVAAAYTSGALSAAQAARVIAARGLAQSATRGQGRMAAVGLPEAEARQLLAGYPGVEVAAVNTARDVTVAGPQGALKLLGEDLAAREVFYRELDVEYPFHSAAMDAVREPLCAALEGLRPSRARIPMVSTVSGETLTGEELDATYWWQNVRRPVRFAEAVDRVLADGYDVLVEVGPHPVLRSYLRRLSAAAHTRTALIPTLHRPPATDPAPDTPQPPANGAEDTPSVGADQSPAGPANEAPGDGGTEDATTDSAEDAPASSAEDAPDPGTEGAPPNGAHPAPADGPGETLATDAPVGVAAGAVVAGGPAAVGAAVAGVVAAGGEIDWDRYFPRPGVVRSLPAYPWQRQRHWTGGPLSWARSIGDPAIVHPLLGQRLPTLEPSWYGEIDQVRVPWVNDHRAAGAAVMPATGYLEMALAAGRHAIPEAADAVEIDRASITRALVVPPPSGEPVCVQTSLSAETGMITVSSTNRRGQHSREHFRARVRPLLRTAPPPLDLAELRARVAEPVDVPAYYARAAEGRMAWGPTFRVLTGLWRAPGEVLGAYTCPDQQDERYEAHPVLLDSALQAGVLWLVDLLVDGTGYMPAAIGAVRVWGRPDPEGFLHVRERSSSLEEVCWDITITGTDGRVAAEMDGVRLRRMPGTHTTRPERYHVELRAAPRPTDPAAAWPGPSPAALLAGAADRLAEARSAWRDLRYPAYAALLEETSAHALAAALAALTTGEAEPAAENVPAAESAPGAESASPTGSRPTGASRPGGGGLDVEGLIGVCREPRHRELVRAALPLLERYGVLERHGDGSVRLVGGAPDLRRLVEAGAAFPAQTALAVRAATRLREVLAGEVEAADVLGADGAADLLEQYHDIGPVSLFANRIARALVEQVVQGWPVDRPLRVLEVGAGTGGTTAALLPVLPVDRTRYTVTDVAEPALARLRQRLSGADVVDFGLLDLDVDPGEQGYAEGAFDLVVAGGCLHAARDVAGALRGLGRLLAPGGKLLAAVPHREGPPLPLPELTPEFRDAPPDAPTRSARQWTELLTEAGYADVVRAGPEEDPDVGGFSVLLATSPAGASADRAALPDGGAEGTWVLIAEDAGDPVVAELAALLRERGGQAVVAPPGDDAAVWAAHASTADRITYALILGEPAEPDTPAPSDATEPRSATTPPEVGEPLEAAGRAEGGGALGVGVPHEVVGRVVRRAGVLRGLAVACEELPQSLPVRLWLVARPCGALPEPEGGEVHAEDAATWGTVRSLGNEQPRLDARRVCLHRGGDARRDAERLAAELLEPGDDDEILLARAGRFTPRLVRSAPPAVRAAAGDAYRLAVRDPGLAYELVWERTARPEPGPGQALVEVGAIGLNYRDVMFAVGLLPSEAVEAVFGGHELGLECAGTVVAVGPGVTRLRPGDRVAAAGPVGFGSHAVIEEWTAIRIADGLGFAGAATLPMPYSTVHHALHHCARIRAGETVLVHGGAGGVGLAALEYARAAGAHVIATAGSEAKRDLLRALGAAHVLDSRSLRFAEQVRELTRGRGVDIVLNSLAGEAVSRSLECLRHGGRFVELGKRDIYESRHLALRPFGDNIAFYGVDVGTLMWKDPALMAEHMATLLTVTDMRPLPHTVFPAERVADAFALMRHSRHIGKVVVSLDPRDEPGLVRFRTAVRRGSGTYLITGGLSGFGAETARRLAGAGVRRLALVSRRGAATPEADALLEELRGLGAEATAHAADVADRDAVARVLRELDEAGHPVRGVVHAAMTLDDAALADLSDDRFREVLRPKIAGALVLDELTAGLPLEAFVLYSSLTTIGNIGQSPYVSANLFLEALARRRRARGLPALAVCLGALAGTGVLAHGTQAEALARLGIGSMDPAVALAAVDDMLADGSDVAVIGRCDWARLRQALPGLRRPWLSAVLPPGADQAPDVEDLLGKLALMDAEEAHAYVVEQITELLSSVLLVPAADIDPDRRLDEYGLDSLMATQLLLSMRHAFAVDIPPMELIRGAGTVSDIARTVLLHLGLQASRPAS